MGTSRLAVMHVVLFLYLSTFLYKSIICLWYQSVAIVLSLWTITHQVLWHKLVYSKSMHVLLLSCYFLFSNFYAFLLCCMLYEWFFVLMLDMSFNEPQISSVRPCKIEVFSFHIIIFLLSVLRHSKHY